MSNYQSIALFYAIAKYNIRTQMEKIGLMSKRVLIEIFKEFRKIVSPYHLNNLWPTENNKRSIIMLSKGRCILG
jgi:hypothetical protein